MLEFRVLGPLEVLDNGRPIALGGPKQRATLAILLLNANHVVSVERLADDLYAGAPPVTAVTQVQRQISELRKLVGAAAIETRSPGYLMRIEPGAIDLHRFEGLVHDAGRALEATDPQNAGALLQEALGLWRGAPLADLTYESFAQTAIGRLEELRLAALEQRFDAELALGRHAQLLPELEALVWDHPLRERLHGQLMRGLYGAGRQADALEVYRRTRERLADELGIEPSESLKELERQMLRHDPALDPARSAPAPDRTLLVVPSADARLDPLLAIAEPLARSPGRALLLARLLGDAREISSAAVLLAERAASLAVPARTAAFTSREPPRDVVRLATSYDVELVLLDERPLDELASVAEHSPADLAVLYPSATGADGGIFVPFGGTPNDWGALELGAWLATATQTRLTLVGTAADPSRGRRDSSRLLADASLAVQRVVGIAAEPTLADPTELGLVAALEQASVVAAGFPSRWRSEGLGTRSALLGADRAPVLLVQRGVRPGGLAPRDSWTRFSWSLAP